jgi:dephospho-CoA kinase
VGKKGIRTAHCRTLCGLKNVRSSTRNREAMTTLGVTGGIGSGKTAACRVFEALGAEVFYADDEAKRLMVEHEGLRADIAEAFGAESYGPDGELNRAYLAEQVFADPQQVERIDALVHPRVFEAFAQRKVEAEAAGAELLVHEAALIFEAGRAEHLDAVAVVDAPESERIHRVIERDGASEAEVRARMAHQLDATDKRRRADYVIANDGTEDELHAEVERVYRAVLDRAGRSRSV